VVFARLELPDPCDSVSFSGTNGALSNCRVEINFAWVVIAPESIASLVRKNIVAQWQIAADRSRCALQCRLRTDNAELRQFQHCLFHRAGRRANCP
jgi:hypothetical protein